MFNKSPVQRENEDEAAMKIQKCWRKSHQKREDLALRAREIAEWDGLVEISQHNDELMEKLKELRISKNYDIQKFDTLLRMPPRDVNGWLENEFKRNRRQRITESDRIQLQIVDRQKDQAARTLQRYV
ncbi:unnamed protein product [Caenorhabditis bovis]|uniref:Uncharacterized protein n=1 Tax=Caenorhabditis bovis TaxID=2654633 RepID=A0A8S1ESL9_9PELO|nr:unnamed protein product [Caenorhabditis bovis]